MRRCKRNKLYREYEEAVKLAKMILRRYDNSIDRASADEHAIILAPDGARRYALVRAGLSDKCCGV